MTTAKKTLHLIKYTGVTKDIPMKKCLRLYELKADGARWNKIDKVHNFDEYLEGDAHRWFLTEIF